MKPEELRTWDKQKVAEAVGQSAQPDSRDHHMYLAALQAKCATDIESSIRELTVAQKENSASQDRLSSRVFWLNVALLIASVVGAAATAVQAWVAFKQSNQTSQVSSGSNVGSSATRPSP
jgi:hypothetical protein